MNQDILKDDTLFLVMNTFSGSYLKEQSNKNIGHENINFFLPNKDNELGAEYFFLWFNSNGKIPKESYRKSDDGHITLLMVTNFPNENDAYRILAIATHCKLIKTDDMQQQYIMCNKEKKYIKDIKYNASTLEKIFKNNTDSGNNVFSTFYTEKENFYIPNQELTLIKFCKENKNSDNNKTTVIHINQYLSKHLMRTYIYQENKDDFKSRINNIKWINLTKNNYETEFLKRYPREAEKYTKETLFTATGTEKNELIISNIMSYCLSNSKDLMKKFLNELKISVNNPEIIDYTAKREEKNVDLTIYLNDCTIIIENKVDSPIVSYSADKFKNAVLKSSNMNESQKEDLDNIIKNNKNKEYCQLSKYYICSQMNAQLNATSKNIKYYLLVPNYVEDKFKKIKDNYLYGEEYTIITYEQIYSIFSKVKENYPYKDDVLKEFEMLKSKINKVEQDREIYKFLTRAVNNN